ncbi:MAG: radical SAM protein [Candidatus Omnitrophota bacterium]
MEIIENPRLDEFREAYSNLSYRRKILSRMRRNRFRQGLKIVWKQGFILAKVIRNYFQSISGKYPLRSLEIAVGYECNFSCSQCSCALNRDLKRSRLSLEQFKDTIDQAIEMGAFQFNLNGGEPMLYFEEVKELCSYIRKKGCYVHMATNGYFFNQERMKIMKEAGLCSFEMGLDSSIDSIHDSNRGEGSYRRIMENTMMAQRLGMSVAYNTVGTKEKVWNGDLINTVYLADKMGVLLMITPPCVTGHWKGRMDVLLNDEEQWYIKWLLSKYSITRIDNYNGLRGISCPAAREKIALNPYGDVVSCPLIQIVYGNITSDRLINIQNKMLKDPFYLKGHSEGCLPGNDLDFIRERLVGYRDIKS